VRISSLDVGGHDDVVVLGEDGYASAPEHSIGDAARGRPEQGHGAGPQIGEAEAEKRAIGEEREESERTGEGKRGRAAMEQMQLGGPRR
jgi:hypothetical protein